LSTECAEGVWGLGRGLTPSTENFGISYITMVSCYAFPVIFIDTVTANRYERKPSHLSCKKSTIHDAPCSANDMFLKICSFQKGHPNQKGGCPDTLDTPLDPPLKQIVSNSRRAGR